MRRLRQQLAVSWLATLLVAAAAHAEPLPAPPNHSQPTTEDQRRAEGKAAYRAAVQSSLHGPAQTTIAGQATLRIPAGAIWIQGAPADRLMRAMGNENDPEMQGLMLGHAGHSGWTALVSYTAEGFVKDNDASRLDANDLLKNLRESTEHGNEDRLARGFPALDITGWLQPPAYDAKTKRLVWALSAVERGAPAGAGDTVNYNTRALGRTGYISLNMLTDAQDFATDKAVGDQLLQGLTYEKGKSYADFNASTDHVAAYGLAALIGVVALKKLGLIALGTAFFLKFAKLGVIAVIAAGAAIRKLLRRRRAGA